MATSEPSTQPPVGVLGTGYMGSRMARRLLDAGFPLTVHNRSREKAKPLEERGARFANTPRDLAAHCEFILSSLADDGVVEAAYYGPEGILAGANPGTIVLEASTVHPHTAKVLHEAAIAKGVLVLDSPVSGSTPQAEQGQLVFMAGGDAEVFHQCEPIFRTLGKARFHTGGPGSGAMMKLVINGLMGAGMQALAEALALGRKGGLAMDSLVEVLGQTAAVSPSQKAKMENAKRGEYPPAFPLRLMYKDFNLVARRAAELSVPMPATSAAQQLAAAANAAHPPTKGQEERDFSVVIEFMQRLAGEQGEPDNGGRIGQSR